MESAQTPIYSAYLSVTLGKRYVFDAKLPIPPSLSVEHRDAFALGCVQAIESNFKKSLIKRALTQMIAETASQNTFAMKPIPSKGRLALTDLSMLRDVLVHNTLFKQPTSTDNLTGGSDDTQEGRPE